MVCLKGPCRLETENKLTVKIIDFPCSWTYKAVLSVVLKILMITIVAETIL